jgi:hypothetical protein
MLQMKINHFNRCDFDEHRVPLLFDRCRQLLVDVHSIASALMMYFRELSNTLCTCQLYDAFSDAFQRSPDVDCRLFHLQQGMLKLPPPHYRYFPRGHDNFVLVCIFDAG